MVDDGFGATAATAVLAGFVAFAEVPAGGKAGCPRQTSATTAPKSTTFAKSERRIGEVMQWTLKVEC
jgi:hypothetical protein